MKAQPRAGGCLLLRRAAARFDGPPACPRHACTHPLLPARRLAASHASSPLGRAPRRSRAAARCRAPAAGSAGARGVGWLLICVRADPTYEAGEHRWASGVQAAAGCAACAAAAKRGERSAPGAPAAASTASAQTGGRRARCRPRGRMPGAPAARSAAAGGGWRQWVRGTPAAEKGRAPPGGPGHWWQRVSLPLPCSSARELRACCGSMRRTRKDSPPCRLPPLLSVGVRPRCRCSSATLRGGQGRGQACLGPLLRRRLAAAGGRPQLRSPFPSRFVVPTPAHLIDALRPTSGLNDAPSCSRGRDHCAAAVTAATATGGPSSPTPARAPNTCARSRAVPASACTPFCSQGTPRSRPVTVSLPSLQPCPPPGCCRQGSWGRCLEPPRRRGRPLLPRPRPPPPRPLPPPAAPRGSCGGGGPAGKGARWAGGRATNAATARWQQPGVGGRQRQTAQRWKRAVAASARGAKCAA